MRVALTRRLGQNDVGAAVDVSTSEGNWLVQRGYATYDPSQDVPDDVPDDDSDDDSDDDARDTASGGRTSGSGTRSTAPRRRR